MINYTCVTLDGVDFNTRGLEMPKGVLKQFRETLNRVADKAPSDSHLSMVIKKVDNVYNVFFRLSSAALQFCYTCTTDTPARLGGELLQKVTSQFKDLREQA